MLKVYPIRTGFVRVRQPQMEAQSKGLTKITDMLFDEQWTDWLPIYTWLIEHEEGLILVDTGETARVHERGYHPSWHPFYRRASRFSLHPDEEIGPQLRALGIAPRDVRQVVLTHLHTDHAGGLAHLTLSKCWVSHGEWRRAQGLGGRLQGYLPHRWPKWWQPTFIRFEPRALGPFEQSMPITRRGDVWIVPTPGHTPHHVSVVVTGDVSYFLAGDTTYNQGLLVERKVDGVSPSEDVSRATMDRILQFAEQRPLVYLPSHDPDSARRLRLQTPLVVESQAQWIEPARGAVAGAGHFE
jgi:N-acyl homoserine lactone hydrolase